MLETSPSLPPPDISSLHTYNQITQKSLDSKNSPVTQTIFVSVCVCFKVYLPVRTTDMVYPGILVSHHVCFIC